MVETRKQTYSEMDSQRARMLDFYSVKDLVLFERMIIKKKWNEEKAWEFLDIRTREDYIKEFGTRDPQIINYYNEYMFNSRNQS